MPDEHVPRPQHVKHRLPIAIKSRLLLLTRTVAWQFDRDGLVTQGLQFRDQPVPTPGSVESAMDKDEPIAPRALHWSPSQCLERRQRRSRPSRYIESGASTYGCRDAPNR